LVAVCLVAVVSVAALALDGGMHYDRRRQVQATADAAALAAAVELFNAAGRSGGTLQLPSVASTSTRTAASRGKAVAAENGFPDNAVTSRVWVNIPPSSGEFAGRTDGYVEAVVEYYQHRTFSAVFGTGNLTVRARAVARGQWVDLRNGIITLHRTARGSLNAHGNGTMTVTGTPAIVNSSDSSAMIVNGTNARLNAPEFDVVGNYLTTGGGQVTGTVRTGVRPIEDPLRYLPAPNPATLPNGSITTYNLGAGVKQHVLTPGKFVGGLSFTGKDKVIMNSGVYYMDRGGFSVSGQVDLTAVGVMIYNAPASNSQKIDISGQGVIQLSAPTRGTYKGIVLFQDRSAAVDVNITGQGSFQIEGTIYAANADAKITGNGNAVLGGQYISRTLDLGGNGDFQIRWNPNLAPKKRIIQLVE
jgi:hypothetical protein